MDSAGNTAASASAPGVAISNPGAQRFGGLTITSYVAPASNIKLLGELPGGQHETWAISQTPQGDGQLALLKYTDSTSWQIVDVLRKADGTAYQLPGGSALTVAGAMSSSGEAWIALRRGQGQSAAEAVFHRVPGGQFLLDQGATDALKPLIGGGALSIRLGQSAGTAYGLLVTSSPPTNTQTGIPASLGYGVLVNGSWTVKGTSLPPGYTSPPGTIGLIQQAVDVTGPGEGWAAFAQTGSGGNSLVLARFDQNGWSFRPRTGLDAFDLTGAFAAGSQQSVAAGNVVQVTPGALRADGTGVWVSARSVPGAATATSSRATTTRAARW